MPQQKCLGCKDQCSMDSLVTMTGCTYEDGVYPKSARIWFFNSLLKDDDAISSAERLIQKQYPDAWNAEEH